MKGLSAKDCEFFLRHNDNAFLVGLALPEAFQSKGKRCFMRHWLICLSTIVLMGLLAPAPSFAQMNAQTNLNSYGGDSREARAARGRCWRKVGIPHSRSPNNEAEASAIRACVDEELSGANALAVPSGPYVKVDENRNRPGCFIIRIVSTGKSFKVGGIEVTARGKCPARNYHGEIIANNQVRISDGRVCTFDHTGTGKCR